MDDSRLYTPRVFNDVTKRRFKLARWRSLVAHVGGAPTDAQKMAFERIIPMQWDEARYFAKPIEERSEHADRAHHARMNHLRLAFRELGPPVTERARSLSDVMASPPVQRAAVAADEEC